MNMDFFAIDLLGSTLLADWTTYFQGAAAVGMGLIFLVVIAAFMFSRLYRKVGPEEAVVRTGVGGLRVRVGKGMWVIPLLHRFEMMDLSVKRIEIKRHGVGQHVIGRRGQGQNGVAHRPPRGLIDV